MSIHLQNIFHMSIHLQNILRRIYFIICSVIHTSQYGLYIKISQIQGKSTYGLHITLVLHIRNTLTISKYMHFQEILTIYITTILVCTQTSNVHHIILEIQVAWDSRGFLQFLLFRIRKFTISSLSFSKTLQFYRSFISHMS